MIKSNINTSKLTNLSLENNYLNNQFDIKIISSSIVSKKSSEQKLNGKILKIEIQIFDKENNETHDVNRFIVLRRKNE